MMIKYKNYFKTHYKYSFSDKNLQDYRNWFYSQWNFINSLTEIKKDSDVLELGSSIGGFYSFIKNKNKKYIGLELDKEAVRFSNNYFNTEAFLNTPIEKLKYESKFDYVFAFEVLEHLYNPIEVIKKINKFLKKDGIFCGTSPYPFYKNITPDKTHLFVLHPDNWKRLFLLLGFKKVELYPMTFLPFLWRINKNLNIRLPFYIPLNGFVSTTLIIARK